MKALVSLAFVGMLSGCGGITVESALKSAEHAEQAIVNLIDVYKDIEADAELKTAKQQVVQSFGFVKAGAQQLRAKEWKLAIHDFTQAYGLVSAAYSAVENDPERTTIEKNLELAVSNVSQALEALGVSL